MSWPSTVGLHCTDRARAECGTHGPKLLITFTRIANPLFRHDCFQKFHIGVHGPARPEYRLGTGSRPGFRVRFGPVHVRRVCRSGSKVTHPCSFVRMYSFYGLFCRVKKTAIPLNTQMKNLAPTTDTFYS